MRFRPMLVSLAAFIPLVVGAPQASAAAPTAQGEVVTSIFAVEGMTCGGCEVGVEVKVEKLDGVESAEASYEEGKVTVVHDAQRVAPKRIIAAIEELGYEARLLSSEPGAK